VSASDAELALLVAARDAAERRRHTQTRTPREDHTMGTRPDHKTALVTGATGVPLGVAGITVPR